jgi:hypothetical protein
MDLDTLMQLVLIANGAAATALTTLKVVDRFRKRRGR